MSLTEQLRGARPVTDHERTARILGDAERGPPTHLRQYHIIEEVGRGGFGVVYRANDQRLRRDVAIKKFALPSETQRAAWGREALALARLSHPNVVQIYEVIDDPTLGQYIVMEYVAGEQLDRWQQLHARSTREILDTYLQVARGLHAAHRLGLVHRDFKPMNAVVAEDGRVRVLDFGLAKTFDDPSLPTTEHDEEHGSSRPDLTNEVPGESTARTTSPTPERSVGRALHLPSTGDTTRGFVGTIGYAAPEQVLDQRIGPRSDQFSFCASLCEALTGRRPYSGRDHHSYSTALLEGRLAIEAGRRRISRRLRRALVRGLSIDPKRRHQSMGSLIEIIETELRPIAGRIALVVLGVLASSAVVVASRDDLPTRCHEAREAKAEDWVTRTEDALTGYRTTGVGDSAPDLLRRRMDDYARRWLDEYQSFCQAEDQDALACLDVQQEGAVTGMLAAADSGAGGSTGAMNDPTLRALALQDPKLCRSRVDVILGTARSDARAKQTMAWIRESRAHQAHGDYEAGMVEAERAVEAARQLGDDALIAASLHQRGKLRQLLRVADASYSDLQAALVAASRSSSVLLRPEIMADLAVHATAFERHDRGDAGLWLALAKAEVDSLGIADTELEAWVRYSSAAWAFGRGDYEPAEREYRAARRIFVVNFGLDDLRVAILDSDIAFAMAGQGRVEDAVTLAEGAVDRQLRLQPEGHPRFVRSLENLGKLYDLVGEPEIALDVYDYSLATLGDRAGDDGHLGTTTERLAMLFLLGAESQALDGLRSLEAQISPGLLDEPTSIPMRYWDVVLNAAHHAHAWSDVITAAEALVRLAPLSEPPNERALAKALIVEANAYYELGRHCRVDELLEEHSVLLREQSPDNHRALRELIDELLLTRPCAVAEPLGAPAGARSAPAGAHP